jgi:hypothetical protein
MQTTDVFLFFLCFKGAFQQDIAWVVPPFPYASFGAAGECGLCNEVSDNYL